MKILLDPVISRAPAPRIDPAALEAALRERVDGEVRFDAGSRAAYTTDASNFRQTPIGVVVPRTPEAGAEAVAAARETRCSGAVAGLRVGSESTLATMLRRAGTRAGGKGADAGRARIPEYRQGCRRRAGDPASPHRPMALEGVDSRLIRNEQLKHLNPKAIAQLPAGRAFLRVQFGGESTSPTRGRRGREPPHQPHRPQTAACTKASSSAAESPAAKAVAPGWCRRPPRPR